MAWGVVYEARQKSLKRPVGLKLILAGEFASEAAMVRFQQEAELIGSLSHPNIVPIYEIGEDEGRHFFSMKLIVGESVARRLDRCSEHIRASRGEDDKQSVSNLNHKAHSPAAGFSLREDANGDVGYWSMPAARRSTGGAFEPKSVRDAHWSLNMTSGKCTRAIGL